MGLRLTVVLGQPNTHLLMSNGGGRYNQCLCGIGNARQHILMAWKFIVVTYWVEVNDIHTR